MNRDDLTYIFNNILSDTRYAKLKTCSCFFGIRDSFDNGNNLRK